MKIEENEKRYKYLRLARELRMLLNMRVTVILMVNGALGTLAKTIGDGNGRVVKRRSTGILRRVLKSREDLMSIRLQ